MKIKRMGVKRMWDTIYKKVYLVNLRQRSRRRLYSSNDKSLKLMAQKSRQDNNLKVGKKKQKNSRLRLQVRTRVFFPLPSLHPYLWRFVKLHKFVNLHQHSVLTAFLLPTAFAFTVAALAQNIFVTERAVCVSGVGTSVHFVRGQRGT